MKIANIMFFCSPGAGIFDLLLPVLKEISKKNKIDVFVYNENILRDIQNNDFLAAEIDKISKKIIYLDSFTNQFRAIESIKKYKIKKTYKILNKLSEIIIYFFKKEINLNNILKSIFEKNLNNNHFNDLLEKYDYIITDACELNKVKFKNIKKYFIKNKIFSIHHGSCFTYYKKSFKIKKNNLNKNINHFLMSKTHEEKKYYQSKLRINAKNLHKVGLAKHSNYWINYVIKNSNLDDFVKNNLNKYVFLISRHAEKKYLPSYQKLEYLQIIKNKIVDELNLKLVIKMHPKEKYENYFNLIFGDKNRDKTWFISNKHPYALGKNSLFTITFFSGLSVDMDVIGKNNIELLNLNQHVKNNKDAIFYKDKSYVFKTRYLNLTNGASNAEDFNKLVDKILKKKYKFKSSYLKYYCNPNQSLSKITKILNKI